MKTFIVLAIVAVTGVVRAAAEQPPTASNPCVQPGQANPRLLPVDEAPMRPDFLTYRARLRMAVERRDVDAVVEAMDANIRLDFGGGYGVAMFRQRVLETPAVWDELRFALEHGGGFLSEDVFAAPYVYARWPSEIDSFECAAITGTNVRLRNAPRPDAPVVTTMSHSIVRILDIDAGAGQWPRVRLSSGREGYASRRYVRSPVDERAVFTLIDGRWKMTAFVAGD